GLSLVHDSLVRIWWESGMRLRPSQQIQRIFQLHVILRIGRYICNGTRTCFVFLAALDMTRQAGLATSNVTAKKLIRQRLFNLDIRRDALALDRGPGRRVIERRCQAQGTVLAERNDRLHRALAEGLRAHNRRPAMILKRTRNDLRRTRRTAIDEDHQRLAVEFISGTRVEARDVLGITATRRDNLSAVKERIRHADRLIKQATRVETKIEDIALQL